MSAGMSPGSEYCNRTATRLAKGSLRVAFWGLQRPSLRAHIPANREQMMWPRCRGDEVLMRGSRGATRVQNGSNYACRAQLIECVRLRSSWNWSS
jgi:hypothetical protein